MEDTFEIQMESYFQFRSLWKAMLSVKHEDSIKTLSGEQAFKYLFCFFSHVLLLRIYWKRLSHQKKKMKFPN